MRLFGRWPTHMDRPPPSAIHLSEAHQLQVMASCTSLSEILPPFKDLFCATIGET